MIQLDQDTCIEHCLNFGLIYACKSLIENGYDVKTTKINIVPAEEGCYFDEGISTLLSNIGEMLVGESYYTIYEATNEDGDNVGYQMFYDEECGPYVLALQMFSPEIIKYQKVLKNNGIYPYKEKIVADLCERDQYNLGEYTFGFDLAAQDSSGLYVLLAVDVIDVPVIVNMIGHLADVIVHYKKQYEKLLKEKKLEIEVYHKKDWNKTQVKKIYLKVNKKSKKNKRYKTKRLKKKKLGL